MYFRRENKERFFWSHLKPICSDGNNNSSDNVHFTNTNTNTHNSNCKWMFLSIRFYSFRCCKTDVLYIFFCHISLNFFFCCCFYFKCAESRLHCINLRQNDADSKEKRKMFFTLSWVRMCSTYCYWRAQKIFIKNLRRYNNKCHSKIEYWITNWEGNRGENVET